MSADHIREYAERVARFLDDSPIMCDWDTMDLRPLGVCNVDAKQRAPGHMIEEVSSLDIKAHNPNLRHMLLTRLLGSSRCKRRHTLGERPE